MATGPAVPGKVEQHVAAEYQGAHIPLTEEGIHKAKVLEEVRKAIPPASPESLQADEEVQPTGDDIHGKAAQKDREKHASFPSFAPLDKSAHKVTGGEIVKEAAQDKKASADVQAKESEAKQAELKKAEEKVKKAEKDAKDAEEADAAKAKAAADAKVKENLKAVEDLHAKDKPVQK